MHIEHLAIWVSDLQQMKSFYEDAFKAVASDKYHNPKKNFSSYFISFDNGCRIELMHKPEISDKLDGITDIIGLNHFAISLGSKKKVDLLTEKLRKKGVKVFSEPRTTGDGYYESVILDPENNKIELVN